MLAEKLKAGNEPLTDEKKRKEYGEILDQLQREVQKENIPVLIMVDGWENSGKGFVIKDLTRELDPRYVRVEVFEGNDDVESAHPSVWRYWQKIPSNQEIVVYDRSFYSQVFNQTERSDKHLDKRVKELLSLEHSLIQNGAIVIKLFLNVSEKTQKKRLKEMASSVKADMLMGEWDEVQNKHYEDHQKWFDKVLEATDTQTSPWHIIDAEDFKEASKVALATVIQEIEEGKAHVLSQRQIQESKDRDYEDKPDIFASYDLSQSLSEEDYDAILEDLQDEAADLVFQAYAEKRAIVLAFEGMDAAGKGGAIKRLTYHMDPRSYKIYGINAPDEVEKTFHYLWRFQREMPKDGDMVIFDRSWYGRVLVERVENFTPERLWEKAYQEINQMEEHLVDHGNIVMKFFLYIDLDEQAKRFQDRMDNPDKNYKITDEDWRNREKAPQYYEAMNEMLDRTNTEKAPWYVVASNQKYYARIQVLKHFIEHMKKALK